MLEQVSSSCKYGAEWQNGRWYRIMPQQKNNKGFDHRHGHVAGLCSSLHLMSLCTFWGFSFPHILLPLRSNCLRGANPSTDSQRLWLMSKQEVFPQSNARRWQDVCRLSLRLSLCLPVSLYCDCMCTHKQATCLSRITCLFMRRKPGEETTCSVN